MISPMNTLIVPELATEGLIPGNGRHLSPNGESGAPDTTSVGGVVMKNNNIQKNEKTVKTSPLLKHKTGFIPSIKTCLKFGQLLDSRVKSKDIVLVRPVIEKRKGCLQSKSTTRRVKSWFKKLWTKG